MARSSRIISKSCVYHVMMRGNNRQLLFEDSEDCEYFISRLYHYKKRCSCEIYAYCLMDNHVHILVKSGPDGIGDFVKRLSNSYVYYFNNKYKRVGHLFQGRFKSEPVETESYFLAVIRYIHRNPVKAGLVSRCEDYPYSSFGEYQKKDSQVKTNIALSILGKKGFLEFHNIITNDTCLEIQDKYTWRLTDREAISIIQSILSCHNIIISQLAGLSRIMRNQYLRIFRNEGISINQLSRITGISTAIIGHV